jgi:hypothetical protein
VVCDSVGGDMSPVRVIDQLLALSTSGEPTTDGLSKDSAELDGLTNARAELDATTNNNSMANALRVSAEPSDLGMAVEASTETPEAVVIHDDQQVAPDWSGAPQDSAISGHFVDDGRRDTTELVTDQTESAASVSEPSAPSLPDPSSISARLTNLVVAVSQVEELSRQARQAAASDLALYSGIAASQRQFEVGLTEARRIGLEAQTVYQRAFGREAKAVAEPAVAEALEVEHAFNELADAWRNQAESFLVEHPDVEALLSEQRQQDDDARRREVARAKAERFQQLVTATDAALREGLLDDARDCLKLLGREFPAEAARVAPLQERLDHRVRAANDAAARRVLFQASELQGRGEFDAAVKLLEAVEIQGLSRETSEDVFGRWSAACSLLGQTGGLELLRYSATQGRGIILHRDPSVPYGLVVFSALGMGPGYFEGRVVSAADREGSAMVARARPFRPAELPPELSAGWYGRSYVTGPTAGAPVRH